MLAVIISIATAMVAGQCLTRITYAANPPSIPSSVEIAVAYADTEGRGPDAGTCDNCFPSPWCGSPGVQFIGASTNYNGNSTDPKNCESGDWDTGAIMVTNKGTTPMTLTNLTVSFPLPSSGGSVVPTCVAEMRPITFNVWFGQQYYWHNPKDPAFDGRPITVEPGGEAIFAGTSSDNSYHCPTGNYPSTGLVNGTYDFDTSDAYYLNGCTPTVDPSSAPQITFSATGYAATTYNDTGHTLDTGGIDTGNCTPTSVDPQWGHENLGWRLISDACGESCPTNQLGFAPSSSSASSSVSAPPSGTSSTTSSAAPSSSGGGTSSTLEDGVAAAAIVVIVLAIGYLAMRRGRRPAA